ncbi:MAG: insulinase family protein [Ottowia sp.]|nr:insulinase family protein [Ottowia sp.]
MTFALSTLARRALACVFALLLTACASTSNTAGTGADADAPRRFTLSNGMELLVQPDHRAPTVVHMLWVRAGGIDDAPDAATRSGTGRAHLLEHLMFKGTERLAPGEFSRRIAAMGGLENAFTSMDYTAYYQQLPANRLREAMELEADRFANARWPDDEFARELQVVIEERRMRVEDSPRARLHEELDKAIFTRSPYHHPVIGWMDALQGMSSQQVRDYKNRWYVPGNAAVVIAGDVEPEHALALAEEIYGALPAASAPARALPEEPPQRGMRRVELKAPAEQDFVILAWRVPQMQNLAATPEGDDALALTVLAAILDGYKGARLERALTQGEGRLADSASASNGLIGRGPQLFSLAAIPAPGVSRAQLEAALREQVARIAREGVGEAELARVKTQWQASRIYERDSVMGQAMELGSNWIYGLPLNADEQLIARLHTITAAQVQSVARRYFGDEQLTVAHLIAQPKGKETP